MEEIKTKVCSCCGEEFPITEFYNNVRTKDGKDSFCKKCKDKSNILRREKKKYLKTQMKELEDENESLRRRLSENQEKNLSVYDGRDLLAELKRRGYVWKDMFIKMNIDYSKI